MFDKHTGELIGYLDLGDPERNFFNFDDSNKLATHALVFYLRGIATDLKYSFAYFATDGITATQLMPLFWEAVGLLELECNLWVVAATSDGASPNRIFYTLNKNLNNDETRNICHKAIHLFAKWRYIYFFSDGPHLLKTARNCLLHSGGGKCTRYMWNDGKHLIWQHIVQAYQEDLQNGLKVIPRITNEHINLTPYSLMTVKFALQVLSRSMSVALREFASSDTEQTATYCENLDAFFDCINVRSLTEANRKRKPFLRPYTTINDERFSWLTECFLAYLERWKVNIEAITGNFTQTANGKMFMSWQTFEGLQITSFSLIECVKFLLNEGMEYVLTKRFCQDPLEQYFGNQRKIGGRSDNPDIQQFGYSDNTIRIQRNVSHTSGNARGRYDKNRAWENVSDDPVPKRKVIKKH